MFSKLCFDRTYKDMTKYIIYCRKSTDEATKQVLSIESQVAELKEFAKSNNLFVTEIITESKTAKEPGREKFNSMLKSIEEGKANAILSWHADRLARNSVDGGKIIYFLDIGKIVDLKFPTFWFDNTPQGKFMLSIAFSQGKYYVDNLSENVKRGIRQKLRLGIWPLKAPFGYKNHPVTHKIVVDKKMSRLVSNCFTLFLNEKSFVKISRYLAENKILGSKGKPLDLTRIRRTLTNKFYIGQFFYKGEWYKGTHKCFISKELFDTVQSEIKKIEKHRIGGHRFAFTGLARCAECGAAITAEIHHKYYKGTDRCADYIYYRCTKKLGKCNQKYISEVNFKSEVKKIISAVALPSSWQKDWQTWFEEDKKFESEQVFQKSHNFENEIKLLDQKVSRLTDGYISGDIDPEIYKIKKNEIFEEKQKIVEKIVVLKEKGGLWLEPFENFMLRAFQARKIASKNVVAEELRSFAKSVGSNFILEGNSLHTDYKLGYNTAFSERAQNSPYFATRSLFTKRSQWYEFRTYH